MQGFDVKKKKNVLIQEDHFSSLRDYKDLSSKGLKHNKDPKRKVWMAAPASKHPLTSLRRPPQWAGVDSAASTGTLTDCCIFQILEQACSDRRKGEAWSRFKAGGSRSSVTRRAIPGHVKWPTAPIGGCRCPEARSLKYQVEIYGVVTSHKSWQNVCKRSSKGSLIHAGG